MRISSGHVKPYEVGQVESNFLREFRDAIDKKEPAILFFDGKDMFDFATPPHIAEVKAETAS